MNDKMVHRRGILLKEWEHKHMNMEIEDLNNYIDIIEKVKVSINVISFEE